MSLIIKSIMVTLILSFLPTSLIYQIPLLLTYALLNKRAVAIGCIDYFNQARRFFSHSAEYVGDWVASYFDTPLRLAKALSILVLVLNWGFSSSSIIALYGLYRCSDPQIMEALERRLGTLYDFFYGFFNRLIRNRPFNHQLIILAGVSLLVMSQIYVYGLYFLLHIALMVFKIAMVMSGFNILIKDLFNIMKQPFSTWLSYPGRIIGLYQGRHLAYRLMHGRVNGSLGPAMGYIKMNGIATSVLSSFLSHEGWFTVNTGLAGAFWGKVRTLLNMLLTSIFISQEMHLEGDFYGTVGPTGFQLFVFMMAGYLIGAQVEKGVNFLYEKLSQDYENLSQSSVQILSRLKWQIGYVALVTPLTLYTKAGAALLLYCQGNLLAALMLSGAISLTLLGITHLAMAPFRRIDAPVPRPRGSACVQVVPFPSKGFMPCFWHQQKKLEIVLDKTALKLPLRLSR